MKKVSKILFNLIYVLSLYIIPISLVVLQLVYAFYEEYFRTVLTVVSYITAGYFLILALESFANIILRKRYAKNGVPDVKVVPIKLNKEQVKKFEETLKEIAKENEKDSTNNN